MLGELLINGPACFRDSSFDMRETCNILAFLYDEEFFMHYLHVLPICVIREDNRTSYQADYLA